MRSAAEAAKRRSVDILGRTTHHAGEFALDVGRFLPWPLGTHSRRELRHRRILSFNFHQTLSFPVTHKEIRPIEVADTGRRARGRTHTELREVDVYTPDRATGSQVFRIVDAISDEEQQRKRAELTQSTNPAILRLAYQLWDSQGESDPSLRRLREEAVATYRMGLLVDREQKLERFPEAQPQRAAPRAVRQITSVVNLGTDLAALSAGAPLGGHIARSLIKGAIFHLGIPIGVGKILPDIIWDNGWVPVLDYSLGFDKSLKSAKNMIQSINSDAFSFLYPEGKNVSNEDFLDQLMKAVYYLVPGVNDRLAPNDPRRLRFRHENANVAAYEFYGRWLEQNRAPQTPVSQ